MKPIIDKPLDHRMPKQKREKAFFISGAVLFIISSVFTLTYLGFVQGNGSHRNIVPLSAYFTPWQFWLINLGLGLAGGILMCWRKALLAGLCGILCALLITGFTMLYVSWRSSIATFEIIIPLIFAVVPTLKLYDFLNKKYYPTASKSE